MVVVDEADRLEAKGRQTAMELLLHGRTDKILYVTATPFALDVGQLKSLLGCFRFCNGTDQESLKRRIHNLGLDELNALFPCGNRTDRLDELEQQLRRWIVRRSWNESKKTIRRKSEVWPVPPDLEKAGFVATVALERAISEMLRDEDRTHIASRRVSLCSSWAAAVHSLQDSPIGEEGSSARQWNDVALRVLKRWRVTDSAKIKCVAERIAALATQGKKVLVFSERQETLNILDTALRVI